MDENEIDDLEENLAKKAELEPISFEKLSKVFDKWLLLMDKNVLRILLSGIIAHQFKSDPLWIFFVAPPSGSKTEIISSTIGLPLVYMLSDLTIHTLASGMPGKESKDPSLLLKLKNNILVMKDFTTVLTMRHEERQVILSQLREVYDGRYSKEFGTGKRVDWEGRLTLIAGVTPIIDTHSSMFQVMGERFIMYRIPQAKDTDVATKALLSYGKEAQMRNELQEAIYSFFSSIVIPPIEEVSLPPKILTAIANLASFIVKCRSGLIRDSYKKELIYIPETEAPSRLAKQLGTLVKALTVLEGRRKVSWEDYYLTLRLALDIIPANRTRHLTALCSNPYMVTTTTVAQRTEYSRAGSQLILEDLTALGVASVDRSGQGSANLWGLSSKSYEYFKHILPSNSDSLWKIFPEKDVYYVLIKEILEGKMSSASVPSENELTTEDIPF